MFMPEASYFAPGGGSIHGEVSRAPDVVTEPGSLFSQARTVTRFRLRLEDGRELNCLLPDLTSGTLDLGDLVEVWGYMYRGVLQVTRIQDADGAELARAGCFVVTAACGDEQAVEVVTLRRFRDEVLIATAAGRALIAAYERIGPRLASHLGSKPWRRRIVRVLVIRPLYLAAARQLRPRTEKTAGTREPDEA